ncbi:MAG: glycosyltransferase [Bacteroidota bacterium]
MIPKKIHYCWYGPNPIPKREQRFIRDWKKLMPDYEFKFWNEANLPKNISYLSTAFNAQNWSNISNYMRLFALSKEGGIYLDTDMEVLQRFDKLLHYACFLGIETEREGCPIANNAILAAEQGHWFINEVLQTLEQDFDGKERADFSSPRLTTAVLKQYGFSRENQVIKDVKVFPRHYFYPYYYTESSFNTKIREDTYTIHHWSLSWLGEGTWYKKWRRMKLDIKWILSRIGLYNLD